MAYKHVRVLDLQEPPRSFLRRAYTAMQELKWYIQGTTDYSILAKTPETFTASSHTITIRILDGNQVEVLSHNPIITQRIDYGRNKKNVERLLATLDRIQ